MWLTVDEPGAPERRVEVGAGAFSVGRAGDCDLVLADLRASRRHAVIERRTDGRVTVRDLASSNGTAVNGQKIAAAVDLHEGERIMIGGTTLTVAELDRRAVPPPASERPTRLRPRPDPPEAALPSPPASAEARRQAALWPRRKILLASAAGAAGLLLLLLVLAQLVLPGIATDRLRDSLRPHGTVQSVSVESFPAVTLLWHHADKVTVQMTTYGDSSPTATGGADQGPGGQLRSGTQRLADFLASTSAADSLDARVGQLKVGRVALESVLLRKRGPELTGSGYASYGDIGAALPPYLQIRSFAGGGGELVFTGAASLLGRHAIVRMRLLARGGALVVQPDVGPFLPSVLSLTVFKDPRVIVESVAAAPASGGFDLSVRARLSGA